MPELRPMVIVQPGENEFTAAMWDEDNEAWESNDGRVWHGNGPDEDDDLLVVQDEPDGLVDVPDHLLE
jgi:hypothetical protein